MPAQEGSIHQEGNVVADVMLRREIHIGGKAAVNQILSRSALPERPTQIPAEVFERCDRRFGFWRPPPGKTRDDTSRADQVFETRPDIAASPSLAGWNHRKGGTEANSRQRGGRGVAEACGYQIGAISRETYGTAVRRWKH